MECGPDGDVVAGPMPAKTLEILKGVTTPVDCILGNAENELFRCISGKTIGGLSAYSDEVTRWVSTQLSASDIDYLMTWTDIKTMAVEEIGEVLFCHATPSSDLDIFTTETPKDCLHQLFKNASETLIVCGHTHIQFDINIGQKRVVNAGSVGMPTSQKGADWLLIDNSQIHFIHSSYNSEDAVMNMMKTSYPGISNFVENNILHAPSNKAMLEMLSTLETQQNQ
ncbi:metallophosphoesterase family protein [Vibrio salinus]|uniref:metallophosphoesterase family protein n=1 Tax=Vibrio salinus TaxID=2899784 RepID=UPI001E53D9DF|nr:metallophosphoesterase family protein [Vibrio salinus]MCE0495847.1 metallophosphatase family protein [Vibrio salinus]